MADDVPPIPTCRGELAFGLTAALAAMTDEERGGRAAHSIAVWLMDAAPDGLAETRALLGENGSKLEPYLSIVETFQEIARRLWYIGRMHSSDRSLDWETRLLWDFTSAIVRDLNETARAVVLLASQGIDAPAKVLLRHGMELYGRELAVLRDEKERALYLRELQRLRDFQTVQYDSIAAEEAYRSSGLVGGALMDRVAEIEQNLDESSLPSRQQAHSTALLLRDLYAYFSNLTHAGPELVDDVLYVYAPSFPRQYPDARLPHDASVAVLAHGAARFGAQRPRQSCGGRRRDGPRRRTRARAGGRAVLRRPHLRAARRVALQPRARSPVRLDVAVATRAVGLAELRGIRVGERVVRGGVE